MTIEVSAFRSVPEFAQGYVRDLRVRWALEEAGLTYEAVLLDGDDKSSADYLAWQPFGQVPAYRDGEVEMFESGAIVLHISEKSDVLSPRDAAGRAKVKTWVAAALNSVEPFVWNLRDFDPEGAGDVWAETQRQKIETALDRRLSALEARLSRRDYLEGRFSAGDIVMATALREVRSDVLGRYPTLEAYVRRCTARPAFARALEAQMKPFREADAA